MSGERLNSVKVRNSEVASYIRKKGAPVHSKPSGADHTILYYPNPDYSEEVEAPKDYASKQQDPTKRKPEERTASSSPRIEQSMRKLAVGSTVRETSVKRGVSPSGAPLAEEGNPNDAVGREEEDAKAAREEEAKPEKSEEKKISMTPPPELEGK